MGGEAGDPAFIFVKRKGNCFGLYARSYRIGRGDEYVEGVEDYGEIGEEFQPNGCLCFENNE